MRIHWMQTAGVFCVVAGLLSLGTLSGQSKKNPDAGVRSVQGVVESANGAPTPGSVVQLKNTRTLQIISFITREQGDYYFHGLSPDIDFELHAEKGDQMSATRTLSSFDGRKQAVINLKLDRTKK